MENQFGLAAQSMAVAVSLMIREDLDGYSQFLIDRNIDSDYYKRMQNYFKEIKKASNIKYIYTINKLDDDYIEFILDAEVIGSPYYSFPGDIEEISNASRQVFLTKQPAILEPSHSAFGDIMGGSAPILDESGNLLGAVGVNVDSSIIFSTVEHLFQVLIVICVLLLVLIFFLLSKVSHFILEPMLKDKLTGAYNKRYFDSLLQKSIENAFKSGQDLTVLMLDLDHFKKVNDTYGHPFGDIVLANISNLIKDCLRKDDFFVRYGGEEFVALLPNCDVRIGMLVAERIRKLIESCEIFNESEKVIVKMTISIGIASLQNRNISAAELVSNADTALYRAKKTRNVSVAYRCEND